jgi:hypothetical protein
VLFSRSRVTGVVDWSAASARVPIFVDPLGYEISFSLQALAAGERDVARTARVVHDLAPFAAARAALRREGVDASWGGVVRLTTVLAGFLREARSKRAGTADLWRRLLELELTWAGWRETA